MLSTLPVYTACNDQDGFGSVRISQQDHRSSILDPDFSPVRAPVLCLGLLFLMFCNHPGSQALSFKSDEPGFQSVGRTTK